MTKVECPGPGFKGLKWKWIQDHAKEQQEREKERLAVHQVPLPGQAVRSNCQGQQPPTDNSSEPPPTFEPCVTHKTSDRQVGGSCVPSLDAAALAILQPQPPCSGVKVEPENESVAAPVPLAPWSGGSQDHPSEERVQVKDQDLAASWSCHLKEYKTGRVPEILACPVAPAALPGVALDLGNTSVVNALAPGAIAAGGASAGASGTKPAVAAVSHVDSLVGSGVSPSPSKPAAGSSGRKSMDASVALPAVPVSLSPMAAASLPLPATSLTEAAHRVATATAVTTGLLQGMVHTATIAPTSSCILTPSSTQVSASLAQGPHSAAAPSAPPPAAQPSATGPASGPSLTGAAGRVRLPPARMPSMPVAAATLKDGDDFESMFTPLSSLPVVKSETPKAGIASRASGLLPGTQSNMQSAVAGTGAPAATTTGVQDAGGQLQGGERKGPLKKASRFLDGRGSAGQPGALGAAPAAAGAASDQTEAADHAPVGRSRTPVAQVSPAPAAAIAPGAAKEASVGGTLAGAVPSVAAACKPQSQPSQPQPHGPGQSAQQLLAAAMATQQRASWSKVVKEGAKLRENGEGAAPPATGIGSVAAGPAVGAGGGLPAVGSRGGDRPPAPASAGSTPAAAPAHSGGEAGERKRPRSEGSKPKAGTSLTGDPYGSTETPWPYGETLADRIKRTKRATTSSSEQDGPQSLGGSAERPTSHAAYAGNAATAAGGEGQSNAAVAGGVCGAEEPPPRPAISAEAQSRGTEPSAPARNPSRGPQAATATADPGADAATGTAGGGGPKQQQRHQQGRDKLTGRSEDPPAAMHSRSGGQVAECRLPPDPPTQSPICNNLRISGGGAVTDSSGVGGGGPAGAQRASGPSAGAKAASGAQAPPGAAAAGYGGTKRPAADIPMSRRHNGPPAKIPRSDPHLPRPSQPHGQDRRSAGQAETTAVAAAVGGNARTGAALPPPPSIKPTHRASSGTPVGKLEGPQGLIDGSGLPTCATGPGQVPSPAGPSPPAGRLGRLGENDMPAAGSCKGPVVAGSRGSKDGAGDKGACGPRNGGHVVDAACGGTGGGGAGAAATTTTEPKTDSDTRTSRVVECYFEFDPPCRVTEGSAPIAGLVPVGPLHVGHGLAARLGNGRFFGGAVTAAAALYPRGGGGGAAAMAAAAAQLLDFGKIRSFKDLWTQLAALYDGTLPDEMDSKIIYLDEEGDWIMVTPDEPWSSVAAAATKVLVTNRT